jgi:hypothetical protein
MASRFRALVALTAFVGSLALPFVSARHFLFDDDAACGQPSFASAPSTAILDTATPASPSQHCPLCHFQRAVGGASPSSPIVATSWLTASPALAPAAPQSPRTSVVVERPSRAPPACVLS